MADANEPMIGAVWRQKIGCAPAPSHYRGRRAATPATFPPCPCCAERLERVRYDPASLLNPEQWQASKAGDWVCRRCSGTRGQRGYRYYWAAEVESDPTTQTPSSE